MIKVTLTDLATGQTVEIYVLRVAVLAGDDREVLMVTQGAVTEENLCEMLGSARDHLAPSTTLN